MLDPELPFVRGPLSPTLSRRTLTIEPGMALAHLERDWTGALLVVRDGELALEDLDRRLWRFPRGSVLCLSGLPLRRLINPGATPTVLVAVAPARLTPRSWHAIQQARDA